MKNTTGNENVRAEDRMKSPARTDIKKFYKTRGIRPSRYQKYFGCKYLQDCSSSQRGRDSRVRFCTGTWPYIGADYGNAQVGGRSTRILFVAMERGGKFRPESEKFADTQRNFRNAAELRWNPHMGGTSQLVECLVECSDRQLYSTQFALTNAVKCVHATNSQKSSSTGTMIGRCSGHLMAEIERLNPHLVITQGDHPRETVLGLFDWKPVKKFTGQAGEAEVMLTDDFVILTTPHPARKTGWRWSGGPLPKFLQNAVHCAIAELKRDRQ